MKLFPFSLMIKFILMSIGVSMLEVIYYSLLLIAFMLYVEKSNGIFDKKS